MVKFKPLTPEQVRRAEQEAIKDPSVKGKNRVSAKPIMGVKYKEDKGYKSLTPPWAKSWLGKYLPPFRTKAGYKKEKSGYVDYTENREPGNKSRVLRRFRSVFPFMLFPDELIVEENRVIWKNWLGPGYSRVISIMATDISNVQASHGPIFGHLHVGSLVGGPEILIEKLSRKECVKARALIEGIILTAREKLAVRKKEIEKEKEELSKLGGVKF